MMSHLNQAGEKIRILRRDSMMLEFQKVELEKGLGKMKLIHLHKETWNFVQPRKIMVYWLFNYIVCWTHVCECAYTTTVAMFRQMHHQDQSRTLERPRRDQKKKKIWRMMYISLSKSSILTLWFHIRMSCKKHCVSYLVLGFSMSFNHPYLRKQHCTNFSGAKTCDLEKLIPNQGFAASLIIRQKFEFLLDK